MLRHWDLETGRTAPARRPRRRGDLDRAGRGGRAGALRRRRSLGAGLGSRGRHTPGPRDAPRTRAGALPSGRTRRCSPPAATRSTCSRCSHGCARCPRSRCAAPSPRSRRARARTSSRGGSRRPAELLEAGDTRGALREARALREIPGYERSRAAVSLWKDLLGVLPRKGFRAAWEGRNLTGHTDQVTALALVPSGRLFSSSMDGTVRAWDLQSEAKADVLRAHDKAVAAIAAGPDGRLLSGGWDHVACAWEPGGAKPRARFTGHTDYVTCAAWAGNLALTGSSDHSLRLWDAASGRAVAVLEGHTSGVSALAVSPDGRFAVSGSWDGTVRAWDLATREAVVVLGGDAGPVSAVAIGPDARQVVSGHQDGAIRLWNLKLRNARVLTAHTAEVAGSRLLPGREASPVRRQGQDGPAVGRGERPVHAHVRARRARPCGLREPRRHGVLLRGRGRGRSGVRAGLGAGRRRAARMGREGQAVPRGLPRPAQGGDHRTARARGDGRPPRRTSPERLRLADPGTAGAPARTAPGATDGLLGRDPPERPAKRGASPAVPGGAQALPVGVRGAGGGGRPLPDRGRLLAASGSPPGDVQPALDQSLAGGGARGQARKVPGHVLRASPARLGRGRGRRRDPDQQRW